jgi:hypothetical protein
MEPYRPPEFVLELLRAAAITEQASPALQPWKAGKSTGTTANPPRNCEGTLARRGRLQIANLT